MNNDAIFSRRAVAFLNRMLVVLGSAVACIILQRYGTNLVDFTAQFVAGTSGMRPDAGLSQYLVSAFAGSAGMLVFQIGWMLLALIVLVAFAALMEWKGVASKSPYLAGWTLAGIVSNPMILPYRGVAALSVLPKVLVMVSSGYLYWQLVGRKAGTWRTASQRVEPAKHRMRSAFRLIGYAFLAFPAYSTAAGTLHLGRMAVYGFLFEADAGTPAFRTAMTSGPDVSLRLAMHDFPDPTSCLQPGASPSSEGLKQMDWTRIGNLDEAEVCMFRLLASYGDSSKASEWLEAQGFRSSVTANSGNPSRSSLDQTLSVQASWPIKTQGHPFRARGLLAMLTDWMPYALSVSTGWSEDGSTLLYVSPIYLVL